MESFKDRGTQIKATASALVYDYMRASDLCQAGRAGMRLSEIFRACGFDWGDREKATSSNQQYWVVALMRQLEAEGKVERVSPSGPWRLR